jgi:hypothetical protein
MLKPSLLIALLSLGTMLQGAQPLNKKPQNENCAPGPRHMRAAIRHIEAGGVGYNKGYSTFEAFIASDPNQWCVMPFLDLRGHVFNDGKMAANAGLGARSIWGCRAYGINAYYDYRNTHHRGYNQVSLGLETLGKLWDLRVNGYLPVGGKVSKPYHVGFAGFSGNSILVDRKFQYAMKGIDGEVGFHFGKTADFDFYGAAGPYYFKGEMGKGAIGGKVRLAGYYKKYVTLEVSDSFDNVFHNNVQGQLTLTLPFGPKSKLKVTGKNCPDTCEFANVLATRMLQPVNRQEIVVVDTHTKTDKASDFVIFVDNESHSAGTFESPYALLADAETNSSPGDIIYVFPGDGTATGMNDGITLKDGQYLLGASIPHGINTNLGFVTIPSFAQTYPVIGNTGGDVIQTGNSNVISGLAINNVNGAGIVSADIRGLTVDTNVIFGNNSFTGVDLTNISGQLLMTNNQIGIQDKAIAISDTNINGASYTILNNQIEGFTNESTGPTLAFTFVDSSAITTNIQGNTIADGSDSDGIIHIDISGTNDIANNFVITSNTIYGYANNAGIYSTLRDSTRANITMQSNQVNIDNNGISLNVQDNAICSSTILDCNIVTGDGNVMLVSTSDNAQLTSVISNTTLESAYFGTALTITTSDNSTVHSTISDSTLLGEDAAGIVLSCNNTSTVTSMIANNKISAGYGEAISLTTTATAQLTSTITGNNIVSYYDNAVSITAQNDSSIDSVLSNNFMVTDDDNTVIYAIQNTAVINGSVLNNTVSQFDGGSGFEILLSSSSGTSTFDVSQNTFLMASNHNINIDVSGGGLLDATIANNTSTLAGNDGLFVNVYNGGQSHLQVSGNQFSGSSNASAEFVAQNTGSSLCLKFVNNNSIPTQYASGANPYLFTQTDSATFNREPLSGNQGYHTDSGVITPVSAGFCE